jgi:hypothetical protein
VQRLCIHVFASGQVLEMEVFEVGEPMKSQCLKGQRLKGQRLKGQRLKGQRLKGQRLKGQRLKGRSSKRQSLKGQCVKGQSLKGQSLLAFQIDRRTDPGRRVTRSKGFPGVSNQVTTYQKSTGKVGTERLE